MAIYPKDGKIIVSYFVPVEKYTDGITDSGIEQEISNYRIDYKANIETITKIADMAERYELTYMHKGIDANRRDTITIIVNCRRPRKKLFPLNAYMDYLRKQKKYIEFLKSIEYEVEAIIKGS